MNEGLRTAIARTQAVGMDLEGRAAREGDPFMRENAEAIVTVLGALNRLRSIALATGMPETLVDKIALDEL